MHNVLVLEPRATLRGRHRHTVKSVFMNVSQEGATDQYFAWLYSKVAHGNVCTVYRPHVDVCSIFQKYLQEKTLITIHLSFTLPNQMNTFSDNSERLLGGKVLSVHMLLIVINCSTSISSILSITDQTQAYTPASHLCYPPPPPPTKPRLCHSSYKEYGC